MPLSVGVVVPPLPTHFCGAAQLAEEQGFDYILAPDTQNIAGDPWGQLNLAASATSSIRVGTGVTNLVTRDPAVTAAAAAALQIQSGGRFVLGIGRGDSSVGLIGHKPATVDSMRRGIGELRDYFAGRDVSVRGRQARLTWLSDYAFRPPPIDVAASGERMIRLAADMADRISLAVGANTERLAWAIALVQDQLRRNGRCREEISVGAFLNVVADPDPVAAVEQAKVGTSIVAHFSAYRDRAGDARMPTEYSRVVHRLDATYDLEQHAQEDARQVDAIDTPFVDWFAIAGTPQYCTDRLTELVGLGLDHLYVIPGAPEGPLPWGARLVGAQGVLCEQVLPRLRSRLDRPIDV